MTTVSISCYSDDHLLNSYSSFLTANKKISTRNKHNIAPTPPQHIHTHIHTSKHTLPQQLRDEALMFLERFNGGD